MEDLFTFVRNPVFLAIGSELLGCNATNFLAVRAVDIINR